MIQRSGLNARVAESVAHKVVLRRHVVAVPALQSGAEVSCQRALLRLVMQILNLPELLFRKQIVERDAARVYRINPSDASMISVQAVH